ncbi:MAG TPA: Fur family transcriptional regulator [Xanthobacteraceae bacterium]|nr:Fur family transcriptional regulator [Xanthobacteraceae bacterium]
MAQGRRRRPADAREQNSPAVFPDPGHDHACCAVGALSRAVAVCAERGERLTPMRRRVLESLAASHRPLGAYEIIDRLAELGPRPAPITVYRALDFLLANGLVHRIESRNAFIACINNHASGSLVVFLICERCGAVGEAPATAVADALLVAATAAAFVPKAPVIEITGICAHCRTP